MFCSNCGAALPDESKFCHICGKAIGHDNSKRVTGISRGLKIVPAKCTSCGQFLEVDPSKEAAKCPYCGSAYLVEQAINNFTVSGNVIVNSASFNVGGDINNILIRADKFRADGKVGLALEYYDKALDIDARNERANRGISEVYYDMAKDAQKQGFELDAIEYYKKAIRADGNNQTVKIAMHIFNGNRELRRGSLENALQEYTMAYNLDTKNVQLDQIIKKIKNAIKNGNLFFETTVSKSSINKGKISIFHGYCSYVHGKKEELYEYAKMQNICFYSGKSPYISFDYPGHFGTIYFNSEDAVRLGKKLKNAQNGIYSLD